MREQSETRSAIHNFEGNGNKIATRGAQLDSDFSSAEGFCGTAGCGLGGSGWAWTWIYALPA
jgi:hypothetical protein